MCYTFRFWIIGGLLVISRLASAEHKAAVAIGCSDPPKDSHLRALHRDGKMGK